MTAMNCPIPPRLTIYGNYLPPGAPRALSLTVDEIGALMHPERAPVPAVDPSRSTPTTDGAS